MTYKNTIAQFFEPAGPPRSDAQINAMASVWDKFNHFYKELEASLPPGPETTTCFRKLLEARDCASRAVVQQ